jgi:hypothetical protein
MRRTHIDYFRELCDSIKLEKDKVDFFPFKDRFLEVYPAEQELIEEFPCAVLVLKSLKNNLDARFKEKNRIEPVFRDKTKYNRYFVKHFKQEYSYEIHFWIKDPSFDIFSTPEKMGILDQALLYISRNTTRTYKPDYDGIKEIEFRIDVGDSSLETGSVSSKSVYQITLGVIVRDGLYTIEEEETISGYTLQIEDPVDVEYK